MLLILTQLVFGLDDLDIECGLDSFFFRLARVVGMIANILILLRGVAIFAFFAPSQVFWLFPTHIHTRKQNQFIKLAKRWKNGGSAVTIHLPPLVGPWR